MWRLNRQIIPKIMDHWKDVAYHSLCYDTSMVTTIEEECGGDPKKCCFYLFEDWLKTENGFSPKTWETLLTQLKEVKELTDKVEEITKQL